MAGFQLGSFVLGLAIGIGATLIIELWWSWHNRY